MFGVTVVELLKLFFEIVLNDTLKDYEVQFNEDN